jgi:hypothetical protein
VEDVTFQFNIVRNVAGVFNVTGYDWPNASAQTRHITIRHNLFHDVSTTLGGAGWFLLIGDEPRDIVVDHNTIDHDGTAVVYAYGGSATSPERILGFRFTNNAQRHNAYGINGANASYGNGAIAMYFPDSVVAGNWLQGGVPSRYPGGNLFSGDFGTAFANAAADDYRLAPVCVLRGAAIDGADIGADVATVLNGTHGVVEGNSGRPKAPTNLRIVGR